VWKADQDSRNEKRQKPPIIHPPRDKSPNYGENCQKEGRQKINETSVIHQPDGQSGRQRYHTTASLTNYVESC
jgi:hypothetical protein